MWNHERRNDNRNRGSVPEVALRRARSRERRAERRGDSLAVQAEAFRILRTSLIVALAELPRATVLVTSALPDEGKTSVATNLAASLAAGGNRVGLVDFDLRHPNVHRWFDLPNDVGVSDVLLRRRPLEECVQHLEVDTGVPGRPGSMQVLTTGRPVEQPTELLSGGETIRLLEGMVDQASRPLRSASRQDIVIIDTPPVLPVADALVIGRAVTGALLVVEAGKTPAGAVQRAKDALIRNQTRLLGVVLNSRSQDHDPALGYGYGYGYGEGQTADWRAGA
jgi:succinoglycan biosynthesis transport protein ExoP